MNSPLLNELILSTGEAAAVLERSTQRVRQLAEAGLLRSMRTPRGIHIFLRQDVLDFKSRHQKVGR